MNSIAVTGHRPNKLRWGYDYNGSHWVKLKEIFKQELIKLQVTDAYSGMALGVDMVFAMAIIELREAGYNIKFHAAIPCNNQCSKWPDSSKWMYYELLTWSDEIIGMSEESASGYDKLELFTVKNNITGNDDYVLLKSDAIRNVDFNKTPLNKGMMYLQVYKPYLMQRRNMYMVDNSNDIIAVWDGTSGGTGNCVEYAKKVGKNIIRIEPRNI